MHKWVEVVCTRVGWAGVEARVGRKVGEKEGSRVVGVLCAVEYFRRVYVGGTAANYNNNSKTISTSNLNHNNNFNNNTSHQNHQN